MSQKVAVIVKDGQNVVSNNVVVEGSGAAGKPLIVKAGSKQRIELKDLATHVAPDQVRVTKDGKNLKIKIGKNASAQDDAADIIIEGYFDNDASLIGVAENGQYYNFIPQGANYASYYSLGGEVIGEETATDWMPLVLGLLGAGALAALASGGGGGGSTPVDNTAPDSLTIVVTDDVGPDKGVIVSAGGVSTMLTALSAAGPITDDNTPTISGDTEAGATVTIKDGSTVLTTVTADANGHYTFTPTTPLSDGTHSIVVTATDAAGNPITETTGYFTIDTSISGVTMTITDDVAPTTGVIANNGVTDDDTPTISGDTEAGATVTIKDGSTVLTTVTADANGHYTFTPTTPLSDGTHSIVVTATDAAGNTITSTTTNFTVDTTAIGSISMSITDDVAPITGVIANNGVTDDTMPTFSGNTEAGATVTIKDGATTLGTVIADGSGNYTFTPTTPLGEGVHSVNATATDATGHTITSTTTNFTVDTTPIDSVSMTITDDVAPITGVIANNGVTDDTMPTFSGNTEAGATVTIKDGATTLGTVTADANGQYKFTPTAPLSEGTHSVSATATDAAGHTITSTTTNFTVDTTAPTATASIGAINTDTGTPNDFITSDTTLIISGTNGALDSGDKVQISLDGGATWLYAVQTDATHWSYDNSANAMISGNHTLQSRVVDAAGNAGAAHTQIITIDTAAPTSLSVNLTDDAAPITGPITAGSVTNDTTPVISGITEAGATVTAKDDIGNTLGTAIADSNGNYTITPTTSLSNGQHYVSVTATDAAGNPFTVSSVIFTVDTIAPTAPVLEQTDGSLVVGTAEPGSTITITDGNGNPIGTTTANQNGNFSYTPTALIPDGTVVNATATDAAGNVSGPGTTTVDATITDAPIVKDDVAPVLGQVLNGDTTNDTQPEISGSVGSVPGGVTVTIYDNGTAIGTTTSNSDGSWSFTPGTPFVDGSNHSITYTKNGSTANHSPAVNFTVDTTAPTITMNLTDDVDPITGDISEGSTTNDTRPAINGTTEAGAIVTIKDGTTVLGTVTADASGNYSFTPIAPLNEGAHSVNATATDAAGNTITSTTTNFTVDSIAPTVEMTITDDVGAAQGPITNGAIIDDTKPTISGTTEAGATVTIKDGSTVLGTVVANGSGNYTFTPIAPLNEGPHSISATATDAAGNTITSTTTNFTVDSIAPTVEMTITDDVGAAQGPVTNGAIIDDTKPTISGKTEAGATVTIKDGSIVLGTVTADSNGDYEFTPDESLSMDEHTITVTATDAAGNTTTSVPTTFTIAPPAVIDLGDDGKLINPVFVDGNWYYYWDKDGDGKGMVDGNPDGVEDMFTHNELDAIFMYDENGNPRPDNLYDTNETYRYAELEGYQVALPTYGADTYGVQKGTVIDNNPAGENNPTYNDLVAIWDAFESKPDLANARTAENGTPYGWATGEYWSSTPYTSDSSMHYFMDMTNGLGGTNGDHETNYVAVQVIF